MSVAIKTDAWEDDIILEKENCFSPSDTQKYLDEFKRLTLQGKIEGRFEDGSWGTFNGLRRGRIFFRLDEDRYMSHMGKELHKAKTDILCLLKYYVISLSSCFIFNNLSERAKSITDFLESASVQKGGDPYRVSRASYETIIDFLGFLSLSEDSIDRIMLHVSIKKAPDTRQRELAHISTYIAIAEEASFMYAPDNLIDDECFIWFFPVFAWVFITFIIPLRATEFLVTPYDCLTEQGGKFFLTLRRTRLKNRKHTVYHEIEKDYDTVAYPVPDSRLTSLIKRYKDLTPQNGRRFLFFRSVNLEDMVLTLDMFNTLLAEFVETRLKKNPRYSFYRYAMNIEEFQTVTAGDSRHIAASNLFFQDISMDLIRQLMAHDNLNSSFHYCSNIDRTIHASVVMQAQRRINDALAKQESDHKEWMESRKRLSRPGCNSSDSPKETGIIRDCIKYQHLESCFGCPLYNPSEEELEQELKDRKARLEVSARTLDSCMKGLSGIKHLCGGEDAVFLDAHTSAARYSEASAVEVERKLTAWQRYHPSQTNCSQKQS